jgi:hypothetical protein
VKAVPAATRNAVGVGKRSETLTVDQRQVTRLIRSPEFFQQGGCPICSKSR